MNLEFFVMNNGTSAPRSAVPCLPFSQFRTAFQQAVLIKKWRISSFFAVPSKKNKDEFQLFLILLDPQEKNLKVTSSVIGREYESLTPSIPAAHWFEREIAEQYGIRPDGHPWLKPIRFQPAMNDGKQVSPAPGVTNYFEMKGDAAHEVAVGPVHAGVIEPGHFRFQCMGEDVYSLEIELGYQHRGIEKMLIGGPDKKTPHVMETISGDSSAAYSLCYCGILESFCKDKQLSPRTKALRAAALELERIANHIGDLGALAGDVAFLPTASYCGRIRGDFLNMTAVLCGNRFGRGMLVPGGFRYDVSPDMVTDLLARIAKDRKELENALDLMFDAPSVLDRLENTGTVTKELADSIGLVGMAGRASGLTCDTRIDLPHPGTLAVPVTVKSKMNGDVLSRAMVRKLELAESLNNLTAILSDLPSGDVQSRGDIPLQPDSIAVSVAEGWRGEICHTALTDENGRFQRYKVVDPSFHNWFGLAMALRDQQISDFPICNKSFNLSYCGHDL